MGRGKENAGIAAAAENANVIGARRGTMISGQIGAAAEAGAETDGTGMHLGRGEGPRLLTKHVVSHQQLTLYQPSCRRVAWMWSHFGDC
jgi:hypothetical protein